MSSNNNNKNEAYELYKEIRHLIFVIIFLFITAVVSFVQGLLKWK